MTAPAATFSRVDQRLSGPLSIGIFVGGKGLRMGGVAKANLSYEGRTLLERTLQACSDAARSLDAALVPRIWLVGESTAYTAPAVARVADEPIGVGPMGGLRAFLRVLPPGTPGLVIAGDLPFLTAQLIERLWCEAPGAAALAPREEDGRWQPLFARYEPRETLPEIEAALGVGKTSLQQLFVQLGQRAATLELSKLERSCLRDWDRPSDVIVGCPKSAR